MPRSAAARARRGAEAGAAAGEGIEAPRAEAEAPGWCASARARLSALLEEVDGHVAAGPEFSTACDDCLRALAEACGRALGPAVRLEPYGSTRQGTALASSDLDIRLCGAAGLEGVAAALGPRWRVAKFVEARVPVLQLRFDGWLPVDLTTAGGEDSDAVDRVLREVFATASDAEGSQAALALARLAKAFAKAWKLEGAAKGLPSSTVWACLAACFLQSEGLLGPSAGRLRLSAGLFAALLAFVVRLGRRAHRLSLRRGCAWPADDGVPPLFVEVPGREGANVARGLAWPGWRRVAAACADAWAALLAPPPGLSDEGQEAAAADVVRGLFEARPRPRAAAARARLGGAPIREAGTAGEVATRR